MQPIDVRSQTRLSLARIFSLCLKGIRHRLFRSVLTTMVIILAVAFFMFLLGDSVIARAVGLGVQSEVRELRRTAVAQDLWFGRPSAKTLARRLAAIDAPLQAYAAVARWDATRTAALAKACADEATVVDWLDSLDAGTLAMLTGVDRADEALAPLATDAGWSVFAAELPRLRGGRPPLPAEAIHDIARSMPATSSELAAFAAAWNAGIEALAADLRSAAGPDREAWLAWITDPAPDRPRAVAEVLARHGFASLHGEAEIAALRPALRLDLLRDRVSLRLRTDEGISAWTKAFGQKQALDEMLLALADPRARQVLGDGYDSVDLAAIAGQVARERDLAAKEQTLAGAVDPDGGLVSVRQGFLVAISFVVCMVGIANAMLMAITERFREIATMKCLGATDGFILTQFLMEAGIQGAAGGAIGMVVGAIAALAKGGMLYGSHLATCFPAVGLLAAGAICIVAGLLLATVASIYPSWLASRMAPMEAMRVE
jgi:hypothetical protein